MEFVNVIAHDAPSTALVRVSYAHRHDRCYEFSASEIAEDFRSWAVEQMGAGRLRDVVAVSCVGRRQQHVEAAVFACAGEE